MNSETTRLVECITAKHECLTQLHGLGLRQRQLIETGEMTRLLEVLAEKQRVIVRLQEVEHGLDPFRHDDPTGRRWSGEAERLHCAALVHRCEKLLEEVLNCEKTCEEALRNRRDDAARQLASVQTAGAVHGAYTAPDAHSASMLDLSADY